MVGGDISPLWNLRRTKVENRDDGGKRVRPADYGPGSNSDQRQGVSYTDFSSTKWFTMVRGK